MDAIRVLIWTPGYISYLTDLLKVIDGKYGMNCKDKSEFGFEADYTSQNDFDRIVEDYKPNIIFLYNVSSKNLSIKIPDNLSVITYCDHFMEQFLILGKNYFQQLPKNNFLYIPVLDVDRIDRDKILDDCNIRKKIYFAPFVDVWKGNKLAKDKEYEKKYECDLSFMGMYKKVEYYYWCYNINSSTFQGRILMHFVSELVALVRKEIKQRETANLDGSWVRENVINMYEKLNVKRCVRDENSFIDKWIDTVIFNIIQHEYVNIVIDWLIERGYNLKIYGSGWNKIDNYKKYAMGMVDEGSDDLRMAYQYSKINIGANCGMGIHRRVCECIRNGSLCFQAETKPEYMFSDYRHFFKDGRDIVVYRNKQELYEKIDYYLTHDDERKQIIKEGKRVLEQKLDTSDIVVNAIKTLYER